MVMKSGRRARSMYLGSSEVVQCAMVVLCSVILYGCASTETKQIIDNNIVSSIKPGKTTKAEVETLLGKPYAVSTYEVLAGPEEEEWNYYTIEEIIPEPLGLLIVPLIVTYATSFYDKFYALSVRFSKEGIVKQIEKCKITGPGHGYKRKCENY